MTSGPERLAAAARLDEEGRSAEALVLGWEALKRAPEDVEAKSLVARLLKRAPSLLGPLDRAALARLLDDPAVDPLDIAPAGWHALTADGLVRADASHGPDGLARSVEANSLALQLLRACQVTVLDAELALTRVRRWLLLSERWPEFPALSSALVAQAEHNGGAWPFDEDERAWLERNPDAPITAAYRPRRGTLGPAAAFADPVTKQVADQYRDWPYPAWSRVGSVAATTIPELVEKLDGGRPSGLPIAGELLIAGCGTGREVAINAMRFPAASITAIDLSETSLAYAAERCRALGFHRIDFGLLDLHSIGALGKRFDYIVTSGVLHHLPDPEAGWARLAAVLRPGGAMQVMVYSKIARLNVRAAQSFIADLRDRAVDDDLLREVRRRLIEKGRRFIAGSSDFYTLAGVHDLLLHRHEDPFDIPRIVRALDSMGLELLAFDLPTPQARARYRREHPHDPAFRDAAAWAALEKSQTWLFSGMYKFWCRKPRP
ncbi:MAG TPA: class I SAM-dependent methyltransferase [Allosphingosinicella sp.]|nr:class I SAM-dependent methyltransferase [Allosphingosinicella sp.]